MNKRPDTQECARILKTLGDESRLQIVRHLLGGEKNVSELVRLLNLPQPQVSHHLSVLRGGGLAGTRREGTRIINFILPEIRSLLTHESLGLDFGCCSIQFDDPDSGAS
ncbi:MAG: winged helix-turn-helix transcriptional regulator [Nitrospina sp.]|nr:winged helix-turn-helix transcriptional regulator [Nitrospina sp.]